MVVIKMTNFTTKSSHPDHTARLCVSYDYHNKQQLFPYTALIGWSL